MGINARLSQYIEDGSASDVVSSSEPVDADLLDIDEAAELIVNRRRRQIVAVVEHTEQTTIGEIAEQLAAKENEIPVTRVTSNQRKRVYVSLYQSHLGRLDDAKIVDWDEDRGTVIQGDSFDHAVEILDVVHGVIEDA